MTQVNKQEAESNYINEIIEAIQCPICYLSMTPPLRNPMILPECGHTVCSECISKVKVCPLCKQCFSSPAKNMLAIQIADVLQKNDLIPIDLNPPPPTENKLIPKIEGICTYFSAGPIPIFQKWFQCKTCHITEESGFCEVCANRCHKGHDIYLVREGPGFYCSCVEQSRCRCRPKTPDLRCTSEMTYGYPVDQPMYQCFDCKITGDKYICQHCAMKCHYAHKLRYIGIVKNQICSCFYFQTCQISKRIPTCSYFFSGKQYIKQPWYHCITCKLEKDLGCCAACAKNCHKGHEIKYSGEHDRCYCDCGAGCESCQKCKICCFHNSNYLTCCTNLDHDHKDEPKEQRMYHCHTCGIFGDFGVCEACAINCHINHFISFVGIKNFACMCHENCKMKLIPLLHVDRTICDRKVLDDDDVSACYTCYTCDQSGQKQICETCALKKHLKHDIHLVGYMKFKCCEGEF